MFLSPDFALIIKPILKSRERDPAPKVVYKMISENSSPVKKTPIVTVSPFSLEYYRYFPNLYNDEQTVLITIKKLIP